MKVLLVDDEAELVSALAERLALRGLETAYATDGDTAVDMVHGRSLIRRQILWQAQAQDARTPLPGIDVGNGIVPGQLHGPDGRGVPDQVPGKAGETPLGHVWTVGGKGLQGA